MSCALTVSARIISGTRGQYHGANEIRCLLYLSYSLSNASGTARDVFVSLIANNIMQV